MFDEGLVDEVRALLDRYGELSRTARQAVGYREVIDFLSGKTNLEDTIELVKTRTRQFARRQMTWFRSLAECRTLETTGQDSTEKLVARIVELTPRD